MASGSSTESEAYSPSSIRWSIALLSLFLPFVFVPQAFDPFQLPKEILFHAGTLLVLGIWLWGAFRGSSIRIAQTGIALPLLLFLFISLLSVFQAPYKAASLESFRDATYAVILFVIAASSLSLRDRLVPYSLGIASLVTACLGLSQILLGPRVAWLPGTQGGAVVGDVTTAATFVAVLLPLLWGLALGSSRAVGWLWAVGSGLATAYVALSRTPSAWSAAVAGALWLLALSLAGKLSIRRERSPDSSLPLRGVALAAVALAAMLWGAYGSGIRLTSNPPSFKTSELEGWSLRSEAWRVTRSMVFANPLGAGIGNWRQVFASEAGNAKPKTGFSPSRLPLQAGNEYLQVAAEVGAAGLALVIWIAFLLIRTGWRRARQGAEFPVPHCAACIVGIAAAGFYASSLREQPVLWATTILAALMVVPASGAPGGVFAEPVVSRWAMVSRRRAALGYLTALFYLLLLGLVIWSEATTLLSSVQMKSGHAACSRRDFDRGLPELLKAGKLDRRSSQARSLAATCALEAGRPDLAEKEIRASLSLNPKDATSWRILAGALKARGNLTEAIASCEKARTLWPQDERINLL
ncbi:MAG TPA: tetratricopeptide repeat protein, partial [Candidatus Polarisedimenticolia bacterium]|nr:tetratricopeptide repeat protein [Candidatus Polarisedimenticolia bacterium]